MSLAIGDETHFCPDPLPTKTPSGGCRYRKRRNVRSPSPKVHIAAVRKERYVVVPASPWWRMTIGRSATVWDSQGDAREDQGIEVRHSCRGLAAGLRGRGGSSEAAARAVEAVTDLTQEVWSSVWLGRRHGIEMVSLRQAITPLCFAF
jgi:hypothetical protein